MRTFAILSAAATFGLLAATASGQIFGVQLNGAQEVPPNPSTATGAGTVTLDTAAGMVGVNYSFSGLSSPQTAAHIHQAPAGMNGGVIIPLPTGSPVMGSFPITAAQAQAMLDGNTYINVHTSMFPGGEIRGQITRLLTASFTMDATQEVPANPSTATGSGTATFNPFTNELILHYEFSGLSSNQTAAHIHIAPPGMNGGVSIPLPSGSPVDGTFVLTDAQRTALLAGNMYVNVHTTMFPGGEIRGQITPSVSVSFLMDGSREVPPNDSTATGMGTASLNLFTRQLALNYEFAGLSSAQTAAHIHMAPAGMNGGVIIPLPNGSPVNETFDLTVAQADAFLRGDLYVNVHTEMFPGGEIRGQLADEPAPTCPCDWNGIDGVNSQDFFDFLTDFFISEADFNSDNTTNSQDFFDFLTCFFEPPAGC
jgi:Cu/Zn superoxide dismutase